MSSRAASALPPDPPIPCPATAAPPRPPQPLDALPDEVLSNILRFVRRVLPDRDVACKEHSLDQTDLASCMRVDQRFNRLTARHLYTSIRVANYVSLALGLERLEGQTAADSTTELTKPKVGDEPATHPSESSSAHAPRRLSKLDCLKYLRRLFIDDGACIDAIHERMDQKVIDQKLIEVEKGRVFGPSIVPNEKEVEHGRMTDLYAGMLKDRNSAFSLLCGHIERLVDTENIPLLAGLAIGAYKAYDVYWTRACPSYSNFGNVQDALTSDRGQTLHRLARRTNNGATCFDISCSPGTVLHSPNASLKELGDLSKRTIVYHIPNVSNFEMEDWELPEYPRLEVWADSIALWQDTGCRDLILAINIWADTMSVNCGRSPALSAEKDLDLLGSPNEAVSRAETADPRMALSLVLRVGLPPLKRSAAADGAATRDSSDAEELAKWEAAWGQWIAHVEGIVSLPATIDMKVETFGGPSECAACGWTRTAPGVIPEGWCVDGDVVDRLLEQISLCT